MTSSSYQDHCFDCRRVRWAVGLSDFRTIRPSDCRHTILLWGSTVGYPSDSLASCSMIHPSDRETYGQTDGRAIAYGALSI